MARMSARERVARTTDEAVAVVAAAINVRSTGANRPARRRRNEQWQNEVWDHYDNVGELRYAVGWFSNALSRATLKVAKRVEGDRFDTITEGPAFDILAELVTEGEGQAQLLKSIAQQYFLPGEWYLVNRKVDGAPRWEVVSYSEMKQNGQVWSIQYENEDKITLDPSDAVLHMWVPHPRNRMRADSPTRGARNVLRQMTALSRHIDSQVYSRLAGAGLLLLPSEMTFVTPPNVDVPEGQDPFMTSMVDTMAAAIEDPGDPAALVPLVLKMPGEHIEKVQHLTFWTNLDENAVPQLDAAIRRLALTLDLPPEVLLGIADVNHWGAWQVDESSIKAHIEPALAVVCASLTVSFLRKTLERLGEPNPNDFIVTFDTSALRMRPNRSKEALELWDRGVINDMALLRESGFEEEDSTSPEDLKNWLLRKVASGSATPEMVGAALRQLGLDIPGLGENNRESRPDPSLEDHPARELPDRPDGDPEQVAALFATCDALVMRAMERAGNRLNNVAKSRPPNIDPTETHMYLEAKVGDLDRLLDGAWTPLRRLMKGSAFHPDVIEKCLDSYCRTILTERRPHTTEELMRFVKAGASFS